MNLWGCQAFCMYEMIILFHPYDTLYGIYYAAWRQGVWAIGPWTAYIMNARAHVAYTMPMRYGRMGA